MSRLPDIDSSSGEPLDALERRIAEGERAAQSLSDTPDLIVSRERSTVRSSATKLIIWAYIIGLAVFALFTIAAGLREHQEFQAVDRLLDAAKTLLIPIVTFVIGHYFGSAQK